MIGASILIVDDHRLFADVIASALEQLGARIVGPVGTAADAIAAAALERPDLVLLDISLPDLDGFDAASAILAVEPDVAIVALTASTDPRASADAVKAGFRGFVPKDARLATVVETIRSALEGRSVVVPPPRPAPRSNRDTSPETLLTTALTDREREVLQLIVGVREAGPSRRSSASARTPYGPTCRASSRSCRSTRASRRRRSRSGTVSWNQARTSRPIAPCRPGPGWQER